MCVCVCVGFSSYYILLLLLLRKCKQNQLFMLGLAVKIIMFAVGQEYYKHFMISL